jgi:hypothetical protein
MDSLKRYSRAQRQSEKLRHTVAVLIIGLILILGAGYSSPHKLVTDDDAEALRYYDAALKSYHVSNFIEATVEARQAVILRLDDSDYLDLLAVSAARASVRDSAATESSIEVTMHLMSELKLSLHIHNQAVQNLPTDRSFYRDTEIRFNHGVTLFTYYCANFCRGCDTVTYIQAVEVMEGLPNFTPAAEWLVLARAADASALGPSLRSQLLCNRLEFGGAPHLFGIDHYPRVNWTAEQLGM